VELGVPFGDSPYGKTDAQLTSGEFKWDSLQKSRGKLNSTGHGIIPHSRIFSSKKVPPLSSWKWFWKLAGVWLKSRTRESWKSNHLAPTRLSVGGRIEGIVSATRLVSKEMEHINPSIALVERKKLMMATINDIRMHLSPRKVIKPSNPQKIAMVQEVMVDAGTGTVCFGWRWNRQPLRAATRRSGSNTVGVWSKPILEETPDRGRPVVGKIGKIRSKMRGKIRWQLPWLWRYLMPQFLIGIWSRWRSARMMVSAAKTGERFQWVGSLCDCFRHGGRYCEPLCLQNAGLWKQIRKPKKWRHDFIIFGSDRSHWGSDHPITFWLRNRWKMQGWKIRWRHYPSAGSP